MTIRQLMLFTAIVGVLCTLPKFGRWLFESASSHAKAIEFPLLFGPGAFDWIMWTAGGAIAVFVAGGIIVLAWLLSQDLDDYLRNLGSKKDKGEK